jgi:hypothetical protein
MHLQQPRRRRRLLRGLLILCGCVAALIVASVIVAAPPDHGSPAGTSAARAQQTVTYIVRGSPAYVTYGSAGSTYKGTVPMEVTRPLGHPQFYAIDAQLIGSGSVMCQIEVDKEVISQAQASGSYKVASCEISPDPSSSDWSDTNSS